ncbi:hypothetical protein FACS1894219_04350 [Clostridia bacterium]|nr:hypothetical protein FACS1894219_04350 [Clostridia bacterium]
MIDFQNDRRWQELATYARYNATQSNPNTFRDATNEQIWKTSVMLLGEKATELGIRLDGDELEAFNALCHLLCEDMLKRLGRI